MTLAAQVEVLQRAIEGGAFDAPPGGYFEDEALRLVEDFLGEPLLGRVCARLRVVIPMRLRDVPQGRSWRTFLQAERRRRDRLLAARDR